MLKKGAVYSDYVKKMMYSCKKIPKMQELLSPYHKYSIPSLDTKFIYTLSIKNKLFTIIKFLYMISGFII